MALATHQIKGLCSTLPSVPSPWSRGCKLKYSLKQSLPRFDSGPREDRFISLKCGLCSSVGASPVFGPKSKLLKISAFKSSSQYDDSKSLKNAFKVSYLQNNNEESSVESSKVQKVALTPYKETDETTTRSLPSQTQSMEKVLGEPSSTIKSEIPSTKHEKGDILKAVCCYFLELDATYSIVLWSFTFLWLESYKRINSSLDPWTINRRSQR